MARLDVLRIRDFRLLLINKFLITFGVQMIGVIVGWQIYQLTHDPLSLGLIGLAEAVASLDASDALAVAICHATREATSRRLAE